MSYMRILRNPTSAHASSETSPPPPPPPCCCSTLCAALCGEEESLLALCTALIYIQIVCSLIGSLSGECGGVLLVHLVLGLFALVAIYERNRYLSCTYTVLFFCSILLDIGWLALYALPIWNIDPEKYGPVFVFVLRLAFATEIFGFSVRIFSSLMWSQIIRTGLLAVRNSDSHGADSEVREKLLDEASTYHIERPHGKGFVVKDDESGSDDELRFDDESGPSDGELQRKPRSRSTVTINEAPAQKPSNEAPAQTMANKVSAQKMTNEDDESGSDDVSGSDGSTLDRKSRKRFIAPNNEDDESESDDESGSDGSILVK